MKFVNNFKMEILLIMINFVNKLKKLILKIIINKIMINY